MCGNPGLCGRSWLVSMRQRDSSTCSVWPSGALDHLDRNLFGYQVAADIQDRHRVSSPFLAPSSFGMRGERAAGHLRYGRSVTLKKSSVAPAASVCLLADRPELIEPVGRMRWREWGHAPEPEDPAFWVAAARQEAGRDELPFSLVAVDDAGAAIGVVGLGEFDQEDLREHSPWVLGMLVDPAWRGLGVGQALLSELEARADGLGYRQIWVATKNGRGFLSAMRLAGRWAGGHRRGRADDGTGDAAVRCGAAINLDLPTET
jgi:GNAT superfamily N-acetyltransferase